VFDSSGAGDGRDRAAVVAELRRKLDAMEGGSQGDSVLWDSKSEYDASLGQADSAEQAADAPEQGDSLGRAADAPPALPRIFDPDGPVLAAPGPIAAVLPTGGLPRGSVVTGNSAAPGGGATSLLLALMAAPRDAWVAAVGLPDLGVLAAAELGVDLARLGLVPYPGAELLSVIAVLSDGVDVIASASPMSLPGGLPPARRRVLTGRLREGGAVLLVAGRWPGADLALTVRDVRWSGIGAGHGRLRDRELDVEIGGRRAGAGMGAVVTLALRAGRDRVTVGAPDAAATAGAADTIAAADVARAVGR
jgi:hypothetical protein